MKLFFVMSAVIYSVGISAQNKIYYRDQEGSQYKLYINDDKSFDIGLMSGSFSQVKDSVYLNRGPKKYEVTYEHSQESHTSLSIAIDNNAIALWRPEFMIGIPESNQKIKYYKVSELPVTGDKINHLLIKDQIPYFLFISPKGEEERVIRKYDVDPSVSHINIKILKNNIADEAYKGKIEADGSLKLSDGRNQEMIFYTEEQYKKLKKTTVSSSSERVERNFDNLELETAIEPNISKLLVNSLNQGLEKLKKDSKTKYLVVSHDPKSKNSKTDFNKSVSVYYTNQKLKKEYAKFKNTEQVVVDTMNHMTFYATSKKDAKWLKSKGINQATVCILDAKGEIVYKTSGNLVGNFSKIFNSADFIAKLNSTQVLMNFNEVIHQSKADATQKLQAFLTLFGSNQLNYASLFEVSKTKVETSENEVEETVEVSNTTDFNVPVFDREDIYKIWKQIINKYKGKKEISLPLVAAMDAELLNEGFGIKLFKDTDVKTITDADIEGIEYIINNYGAIDCLKDDTIEEMAHEGSTLAAEQPVLAVLYENSHTIVSALNNTIYAPNGVSLAKKYDFIGLLEELMKTDPSEILFISRYMTYHEIMESTDSSLDKIIGYYDKFYQTTFGDAKNYVDYVDQIYMSDSRFVDYVSWTDFKSKYSELANEAAWMVLQNKSKHTKSYIQKGIKWANMATILYKDNPFYYDTLSKLYLAIDDKDRAVIAAERALKYASKLGDDALEFEMRSSLNKLNKE